MPAQPDGTAPDGGSGRRLLVAQALADAAAVGLQNQRACAEYRTLAVQLQEALSSRVRIEQAKVMLAERWNTGADQAFTALRRYARRHRLPLDRVASAVVERVADDGELRREAEGQFGGTTGAGAGAGAGGVAAWGRRGMAGRLRG